MLLVRMQGDIIVYVFPPSALWIAIAVNTLGYAIVLMLALVMYAYYFDCNPVMAGRISKGDQVGVGLFLL